MLPVSNQKMHTDASAPKKISMKEVMKHNGRDGTWWTVVENSVYDITDFMAAHPGGDVIRTGTGIDSTDLVESYHPSTSSAAIKLALRTKCTFKGVLEHPEPTPDNKFFVTCRARVEEHLKEKGLPRTHNQYLASFEIIATVALWAFFSLYKSIYGVWWPCFPLAVVMGRLGFLMHTGNHRGNGMGGLSTFAGKLMDLVGGNSLNWSYEHQVAHHLHPNEVGKDNDCSIAYPILRFNSKLARHWWHKVQPIVMVAGMSIGLTKWYFADMKNYYTGHVGSVHYHATKQNIWFMIAGKSFFMFLHVILPMLCGHSFAFGALSIVFVLCLTGQYIENIFIVNHIQEYLEPAKDHESLHWANQQVKTTCNWGSESHLMNFISGGLNHQIEHHMFPSLHHYHYPSIAPIVKQTCEEFDIPYKNYPTFFHAWMDMARNLQRLGDEE